MDLASMMVDLINVQHETIKLYDTLIRGYKDIHKRNVYTNLIAYNLGKIETIMNEIYEITG